MVLIMLSLALEAEGKDITGFQTRKRDEAQTGLVREAGPKQRTNRLSTPLASEPHCLSVTPERRLRVDRDVRRVPKKVCVF